MNTSNDLVARAFEVFDFLSEEQYLFLKDLENELLSLGSSNKEVLSASVELANQPKERKFKVSAWEQIKSAIGGEGATVEDIHRLTGRPKGTINTLLYTHKAELERSTSRPTVYYNKGQREDIKKALPSKFSFMG